MKSRQLPLHDYLIGLGSNFEAEQWLYFAFTELRQRGQLLRSEPEWSPPEGAGSSAPYLNAAVVLRTREPAYQLGRWLKQLEQRSGRTPARKAAGMVALDADLLARRVPDRQWKIFPRRLDDLQKSYLQRHLVQVGFAR